MIYMARTKEELEEDSKKSFFVRWWFGIKGFYSSVVGLLFLKLVFLSFVVFGLFVVGLFRWFSGDFWFGLVLVFFGFVSLVDWVLLFKNYKGVKKGLEGL